MFRLIKLLLGLCGLALFVWFGSNIPLGSRTLFQHLQAIGGTRETQDLLDGTRQSAQPIVDGVRKRLGPSGGENATVHALPDGGAPPSDQISHADREHLRKVLGSGHASR